MKGVSGHNPDVFCYEEWLSKFDYDFGSVKRINFSVIEEVDQLFK